MFTIVQIGYFIMLLLFFLVYFMYAHAKKEKNNISYTFRKWKEDYFREQNEYEQNIYSLKKEIVFLKVALDDIKDDYKILELENMNFEETVYSLESKISKLKEELVQE